MKASSLQQLIFSGVAFAAAADQPLHAAGSPAADFLLLEEAALSSDSTPLLNLVVLWQASCPLRRQLTGQSHLRIAELDTDVPSVAPLAPPTLLPPISEAQHLVRLSKLVKMNLLYETRVQHDFRRQR